MAAWRETEESQASEEEEEDEEEDEEGYWEYDSTWEDEDEVEEEQKDGAKGQLEEEQGRKESDAAAAAAAAAENTEETENRENPQPPVCWQPPNAKWAQPQGNQEQRKSNIFFSFGRFKSTSERNWMAARDMQRYRQHYPGLEETDTEAREEEMWNLSFYKNEIRFLPRACNSSVELLATGCGDGTWPRCLLKGDWTDSWRKRPSQVTSRLYIDELLELWQNDYKTLEENHSYIQWLFPLREQGMNWRAKLLTCKEIQAFKKSKEVMERFIQVYKLMLGFYGIDLINKETGELRRAENWRERFHNLNQYSHNNLRITRILKCLGELGLEHYQVHLVKFFLTETLVHQTLPRVRKSALDYFMFTVRNKQKRRELIHFAWQHFDRKREFVWGPRKKLLKFKPRSPEFLSTQKFAEEQEAAREGAGEAEGKNRTKPPTETCLVGHAVDRATNLPSGDPVPGRANEREATSAVEGEELQAGKGAEPQAEPVTELEASEKVSELSPASAAKEEAKGGCSGQEDAPVSYRELGGEGLAGEPESGRGAADGESLKESKKRKLEMNRRSDERAASSKSPTDIEKISCNLEEVVIDKKGPDCPPLAEETCDPLAPEGGETKGVKEAESVSAKVKRRKVDEIASRDSASEKTGKAGAEVTSSPGQVTNCMVPGSERTDQVCQDEVKAIDASTEALTDCRTVGVHSLASSGNSTEPGLPSDVSVPDKGDEQGATSMPEGQGSQPCERLPASNKGEDGGRGQAEGGEDAAGERKSPPPKPEVEELHPKKGEGI